MDREDIEGNKLCGERHLVAQTLFSLWRTEMQIMHNGTMKLHQTADVICNDKCSLQIQINKVKK